MAAAASCALASSSICGNGVSVNLSSAARKKNGSSVRMIKCEGKSNMSEEKEEDGGKRRRAMVVGVLGAAVIGLVSSSTAAMALPVLPPGEPKPGSPEALKKYARVCRSNPTAWICHY